MFVKTKLLPAAENAHAYPLLIKQLLLSAPRFQPEQVIVNGDQGSYTYLELIERIHRLAGALTAAGVKPGDTVAVLEWDTPRYLECFFAIPMLGAVLHMVNVRLSPEQIVYTMNHAEDDLVLVNDEFLPLVEQIHGELTTVKQYIRLSDSGAAVDTNLPVAGEYEALLAAAPAHYDFPDFDENSIATTFYTTGTTGNPKGVFFSHRQLVLHTLAQVGNLGSNAEMPLLRSDDVYMPITPMFHVHAWGVPYAATVLGVKQIYPGRYEPEKLVTLIKQHDVTFSHCVPTIMQMLFATDGIKDADLSRWKVLIGGSALTAGLCRAALERGIDIFTGYGMSETCPLLSTTYLRPGDRERSLEEQVALRTKTGIAGPLVALEIMGEGGEFLPHDGDARGEIVCRAPWLTQGYLKEPEKGAELWASGWLHTGDVAYIEPDHNIVINDRIKDVIKTGGEWISSLELENLISQHSAVAAAAVVGVKDAKWGERPHALVIAAPGAEVDAEAIKAHLQTFVEQGEINKWAIPTDIDFVADIPKTSVGKIDKKLIRSQLAGQ